MAVGFPIRDFYISRRVQRWRKPFPILLTDSATLKKWECLDSASGEDLAEEVRRNHIPDFQERRCIRAVVGHRPPLQNPATFIRAFARLEKDLRTSVGK